MPAEGRLPSAGKAHARVGCGFMSEWKLLERISREIPKAGDDCAVIPFRCTNLVLATDMLHQASDFPPGTTPYTIGWRSVGASLSDVAAMGGRPLGVVLALSAPSPDELFWGVLSGAQDLCRLVDTELLGGDLDSSEELFLCSSALGVAAQPVLRSGARPGDLLCLTGPLGRTALALHLFAWGKLEEANQLFRFTPRVEEGLCLAGLATSMIDISDGLAHSVHLLARASGVGFQLRAESLPLIPGLPEAFPGQALQGALYFGEDYELLYTVSQERFRPELDTAVGEAVETGVWLLHNGKLKRLPDRGWEHGR